MREEFDDVDDADPFVVVVVVVVVAESVSRPKKSGFGHLWQGKSANQMSLIFHPAGQGLSHIYFVQKLVRVQNGEPGPGFKGVRVTFHNWCVVMTMCIHPWRDHWDAYWYP